MDFPAQLRCTKKNFDPRDVDPSSTPGFSGDREKADALLAANRERLAELQELLYAEGKRSVLLVLQGMDTSGKDGTVSSVLGGMNPLGCRVACFKKPSEEELAHDYLWRIHNACPRRGEIGVFNRSHYEDVLVVRVLGLISAATCTDRYEQINRFEQHLTDNGTTIVKCFLHISKDEQKQRLEDRLKDPAKQWKFQPDDLDTRAKWADYMTAYRHAISATGTAHAPWHVIPANKKWYRNLLVSTLMVQTLEALKPRTPRPGFDPSSITIT